MESILIVDEVYKKVIDEQREFDILRNISFTLNSGDFAAVYGPSGSGKTTLLSICGGLQEPTSGDIILENTNLYKQSKEDLMEFRHKHIGFVHQYLHFFPHLNTIQSIISPLLPQKLSQQDIMDRAKSTLSQVNLENLEEQDPYQLSNEEKKRIAIARAIITNPTLLLIDEPTGNVDSNTGNEIMNLLASLNQNGQTTLVFTHDPEILRYANRIFEIKNRTVLEMFKNWY